MTHAQDTAPTEKDLADAVREAAKTLNRAAANAAAADIAVEYEIDDIHVHGTLTHPEIRASVFKQL